MTAWLSCLPTLLLRLATPSHLAKSSALRLSVSLSLAFGVIAFCGSAPGATAQSLIHRGIALPRHLSNSRVSQVPTTHQRARSYLSPEEIIVWVEDGSQVLDGIIDGINEVGQETDWAVETADSSGNYSIIADNENPNGWAVNAQPRPAGQVELSATWPQSARPGSYTILGAFSRGTAGQVVEARTECVLIAQAQGFGNGFGELFYKQHLTKTTWQLHMTYVEDPNKTDPAQYPDFSAQHNDNIKEYDSTNASGGGPQVNLYNTGWMPPEYKWTVTVPLGSVHTFVVSDGWYKTNAGQIVYGAYPSSLTTIDNSGGLPTLPPGIGPDPGPPSGWPNPIAPPGGPQPSPCYDAAHNPIDYGACRLGRRPPVGLQRPINATMQRGR